MAFKQKEDKNNLKVKVINTPSAYGSHSSMVVEELENGKVICEDPYGRYETYKDRLDNGLADPCRNRGSRI